MPLRRRAWLSREGWYYCGVLAFIVGGAVLRSINLLVILAGLMIAPPLLNWRLVMASLWGLVASRKLPEQICAGEPLVVEIAAENTRRRMTSWLVTIEDWAQRDTGPEFDNWGAGAHTPPAQAREPQVEGRTSETAAKRLAERLIFHTRGIFHQARQHLQSLVRHADRTRAQTLIAALAPQEKVIATYRITLHRRGKYRFGPLRVSTRYPLGLVWGQFTLPSYAELIVAPRVGRLSPEWANLLEAERAGDQRRQPQRGFAEGDYYGLRPWQSGDSTRWIHWRTTAKTGVPTVLQFERQRNRDVALILDPWLPIHAQERDHGYLELAVSLAATAVADLTTRGHSRLVFAVAGERPDCWSGPASGIFCQELLAQLAVLPASDGRTLPEAIALARDQAPGGARLIVISPRLPAAELGAGDDVLWIDVCSGDLAGLFTLE
jgi:hypothetical protein